MRFVIVLLCFIPSLCLSTDRQGPDYYEFLEEKKAVKKETRPEAHISNTQIVEQLKQIHLESLNTSILNPTEKNILRERMLAIIYMDLAQKYQHRAQIVVDKNPRINYLLKHPVDDEALKLQEAIDDSDRDERIKKLTKSHGLFFFFAGGCQHCKAFAPTIKRFAKKYGFEVIAISVDGGKLSEFPNAKRNDGQAEKLMVKSLPAVFAIDPKNGPTHSILLSYGNVSVMELTQKLDLNWRHMTGQVKYELLN